MTNDCLELSGDDCAKLHSFFCWRFRRSNYFIAAKKDKKQEDSGHKVGKKKEISEKSKQQASQMSKQESLSLKQDDKQGPSGEAGYQALMSKGSL